MRIHLLNFLKVYLKKPLVWLLATIYALLLIQISMNNFETVPSDWTGLYFFWNSAYLDAGVPILLLLLTSLSSVHFLIDEWNSGYILFYLNRTSLRKYVINLLLRIVITASIVPFIGIFIYSLVILSKFPFVGNMESNLFINSVETLVNGPLLATNFSWLFYVLLLLNIIYNHLVYIIFSVCLSVFINNKYIIYIFPTILHTIVDVIANMEMIPILINPQGVFGFLAYIESYLNYYFGMENNLFLTAFYPTCFFILLLVLVYLLIFYSLKLKINKGVSWGGGIDANI